MPAFKTGDAPSGWSFKGFRYSPTRSTKWTIMTFVGVERDSVDISPVLNADARDDFIGSQFKRIHFHVPVLSRAANTGERPRFCFELDAIHVLPVPNAHLGDPAWGVSKSRIRHSASPATFGSEFFDPSRISRRLRVILALSPF